MPRVDTAAPATTRGDRTILIVDDEDALRGIMREVLEGEGYAVLEARSGLEAIELMEHEAIDLLVTDHGLPGMQGRQVVDTASKAHPGLPVLYISGYGQDPLRDGGHSFLAKPFAANVLVDRVKGLLTDMTGA